jgi:predicted transcriptional regulator
MGIGTPHDQTPEKVHVADQVRRPESRTARPLKQVQVDALLVGYEAGRTMKELAAEFGIDRRTVSTYLRRASVDVRRGGLDPEQAVRCRTGAAVVGSWLGVRRARWRYRGGWLVLGTGAPCQRLYELVEASGADELALSFAQRVAELGRVPLGCRHRSRSAPGGAAY